MLVPMSTMPVSMFVPMLMFMLVIVGIVVMMFMLVVVMLVGVFIVIMMFMSIVVMLIVWMDMRV